LRQSGESGIGKLQKRGAIAGETERSAQYQMSASM